MIAIHAATDKKAKDEQREAFKSDCFTLFHAHSMPLPKKACRPLRVLLGAFFERGAETPGAILCHSGIEIAMSFRHVDFLTIVKAQKGSALKECPLKGLAPCWIQCDAGHKKAFSLWL